MQKCGFVGTTLLILIFSVAVNEAPAESIPAYTLDSHAPGGSAGGLGSSTSYILNNTVSQPTPIGISTGLTYDLHAGFQPSTADNYPPRAHAGFPQSIKLNKPVQLDGTRSYDPDGALLQFRWSLVNPDGSDGTSELSDPAQVDPTFTPSMLGTYTATLIVSDGTFESLPDAVELSMANVPPVADAGMDRPVALGDEVTLDGSASFDAENAPLTYQWSLIRPDGSDGTPDLSDAAIVNPTFTVAMNGTYGAFLTVDDGRLGSKPDTVLISTANVMPVAQIDADELAYVNKEIMLDASGSFDPNGETPLSFSWAFTHIPADSSSALSSPDAASTSFIIDAPGTYIIALTVNDGTLNSFPETIVLKTVTHQQAVLSLINDVIAILKELDATQLMNRNSADALINKLEAIIEKISTGYVQGALWPLQNDILPRVDGCILRGEVDGMPPGHERYDRYEKHENHKGHAQHRKYKRCDRYHRYRLYDKYKKYGIYEKYVPDWVTDCEPQQEIYLSVAEVIEILEYFNQRRYHHDKENSHSHNGMDVRRILRFFSRPSAH